PKADLSGGLHGVAVPWVYRGGHAGFRVISTPELHAAGIVLIGLGWLFLSGAFLFVLLPVLRILRLLGIAISAIIYFALVLMMPILKPAQSAILQLNRRGRFRRLRPAVRESSKWIRRERRRREGQARRGLDRALTEEEERARREARSTHRTDVFLHIP